MDLAASQIQPVVLFYRAFGTVRAISLGWEKSYMPSEDKSFKQINIQVIGIIRTPFLEASGTPIFLRKRRI
jgi:hypothetical protein